MVYAEKEEEDSSRDEEFQKYLVSLGFALNNEEMDTAKNTKRKIENFNFH